MEYILALLWLYEFKWNYEINAHIQYKTEIDTFYQPHKSKVANLGSWPISVSQNRIKSQQDHERFPDFLSARKARVLK